MHPLIIRTLATTAAAVACSVALAAPSPADAASSIQLGKIQYNAPGSDTATNTSVNGEYVVVKNLSSRSITLTGWTVRDAQSHVYTFGSYALPAYKSVTLHTGKGTNGALVRYWGLSYHVWNNTGDTATIRTAGGTLLDTCRWTTSGAGYTGC
jgi:ABC-type Fe3+-hydroxamate transport system substrate-binding protein